MERESKIYVFIVFLFALSLVLFFMSFYANTLSVLQKKEIPVSLRIGDTPGIDVNNTALTFGTVSPGSSIQRNLIIQNDYPFSLQVELEVQGDLERYLSFEKVIFLDINEKKEVPIRATVSNGEEFVNYTGKIIIVFKKDI